MLFDYNEEEQIKDKKGNMQYFIQIRPFTANKIFNDSVSIRQFGNSLIFYSIGGNLSSIFNLFFKKFFNRSFLLYQFSAINE